MDTSTPTTPVPWADLFPLQTAQLVLRSRCGHVDVAPLLAVHIAEYALTPLTWEYVLPPIGCIHDETARYVIATEAQTLQAVEWLVAHNVRYPLYKNLHDNPKFDEFVVECEPNDVAAERGFLSVVKYLDDHFERGRTIAGLVKAAEQGHLDLVRHLCDTAYPYPFGVFRIGCDEAIERAAAYAHIDAVKYLHGSVGARVTEKTLKRAAATGNVELFQYLWHALPPVDTDEVHHGRDVWSILQNAVDSGSVELVRWICQTEDCCSTYTTMATAAALHGKVAIVKLFFELKPDIQITSDAMNCAASCGDLAFLKYLHFNRTDGCTSRAMDGAAGNGHLDVVKFLQEHRTEGCSFFALATAAQGGHLDVVKYLLKYQHRVCSTKLAVLYAVGSVVRGGRHVHVLKYLLQNCVDSSTADMKFSLCDVLQHVTVEMLKYLVSANLTDVDRDAFVTQDCEDDVFEYLYDQLVADLDDEARMQLIAATLASLARRKKLNHIKILDSRRREGELYHSEAMNIAAETGNLALLKYLHHTQHAGCTSTAMDSAAARGDLAMVKFLHFNRSEGCTTAAIDSAAIRGDLAMVRFLHFYRRVECSAAALDSAVKCGHVGVVEFLRSRQSE